MFKNFEEFLREVFSEGYEGTKEDFEDHFDLWLSELDTGEIFDLADGAIKELRKIKN